MNTNLRIAFALSGVALLAIVAYTHRRASAQTPATAAAPEAQPAFPTTIDYESHLSAGHSPPPAGVLVNPYKDDKAMAAAGANLFASMNCEGCHGIGASGFAAPSLSD